MPARGIRESSASDGAEDARVLNRDLLVTWTVPRDVVVVTERTFVDAGGRREREFRQRAVLTATVVVGSVRLLAGWRPRTMVMRVPETATGRLIDDASSAKRALPPG